MAKVPYSPIPSVTAEGPLRNIHLQSDRGATEEAFGSGVGTALQGLARNVESVADIAAKHQVILHEDQLRRQNFDHTAELIKLNEDVDREFVERSRKAEGTDATDLHKATMESFQKRANDFLSRVRPQDKEQWRQKLTGVGADLSKKAFTGELSTRDKTHGTKLNDIFSGLSKRLTDTPAERDKILAEGDAAIDATALPNKDALKKNWRGYAANVYFAGEINRNPEGVIVGTGKDVVGPSYYSKIATKESGGNDNAANPNSSAVGRYQFLGETWKGLVNSAEGKAAGLTLDGRTNREQQEKAIRIFTAQNAQTLRKHNIEVTEANLYVAHFLGAGGAVNFLAGVKNNPDAIAATNHSDAAAANKTIFYDKTGRARTHAEVYQVLTKNMGDVKVGTSVLRQDPWAEHLTFADREKLVGTAERFAFEAEKQRMAATINEHKEFMNGLQNDLLSGIKNRAHVDAAIAEGKVPLFEDRKKLYALTKEKQDQDQTVVEGATAFTKGEGYTWNRAGADDKKRVEAVYDQGIKGMGQTDIKAQFDYGAELFRRSGIVPKTMASQLVSGLLSSNPQTIAQTFDYIARMGSGPHEDAFASAGESKARLEEAYSFFLGRVNQGKSMADIQKEWMQNEDPAVKKSMVIRNKETEEFKKSFLSGKLPAQEVKNIFGSFWSKPDFSNGAGRAQVLDEYASYVSEYYNNIDANLGSAKIYAKKQIEKTYGVSQGKLQKFAPEKVYPMDVETKDHSYLYSQAAEEIKKLTGFVVEPKDIELRPLAKGLTANAFGQEAKQMRMPSGEVVGTVPYQVVYRRKTPEGFYISDILAPDKKKPMDQQGWVPSITKFDEMRAQRAKKMVEERKEKIEAPPPELPLPKNPGEAQAIKDQPLLRTEIPQLQ